MNYFLQLVELVLNIDKYLADIVTTYGAETYVILFLIVLAETGLVIAPFLPGDSLLFAAGIISANSSLNVAILFVILTVAAIFGDNINYSAGKYFGTKIKDGSKLPFIKPEHVKMTEDFYEKYGNKTIIIARFVPIVRTMAPFFAGFGSLNYSNFIFYNIVGGISWVSIFLLGGYYLGNIKFVQDNFSLVIILIIIASIIPGLFEIFKARKTKSSSE